MHNALVSAAHGFVLAARHMPQSCVLHLMLPQQPVQISCSATQLLLVAGCTPKSCQDTFANALLA